MTEIPVRRPGSPTFFVRRKLSKEDQRREREADDAHERAFLQSIEAGFNVPPLVEVAQERIESLAGDMSILLRLSQIQPRPEYISRALSRLEAAGSWDSARSAADLLSESMEFLGQADAQRILRAFLDNDEVAGSRGIISEFLPSLLTQTWDEAGELEAEWLQVPARTIDIHSIADSAGEKIREMVSERFPGQGGAGSPPGE